MTLSELYAEMSSKYGFNDGRDIPKGVQNARKKLVEFLNKSYGGNYQIEAFEYEPPGSHNWCMIAWRNRTTKKDSAPPDGVFEILYDEEDQDEGLKVHTTIEVY
jgi:hypothetical protein